MRSTYAWPHRHVAEVNGRRTKFSSYYRWGTFGLHSDAVAALQEAGIYERPIDWERLKIDGHPHVYI